MTAEQKYSVHRLGDASVAEINAAYNAIKPDLVQIIQQNVPGFYQNTLLEKMQTPQAIQMMCKVIDDGLNAAEAVRQQQQAKK